MKCPFQADHHVLLLFNLILVEGGCMVLRATLFNYWLSLFVDVGVKFCVYLLIY